MIRSILVFVISITGAFSLLAACSGAKATTVIPPALATEYARPTPPAEYSGKKNPYAGDADAEAAGKTFFDANCAACHGEKGMGDGPAAMALNPKPKALAVNQSFLADDYMFWRISDGGKMEPFNSAMPAWKGVMQPGDIWQVIAYIHTLQ